MNADHTEAPTDLVVTPPRTAASFVGALRWLPNYDWRSNLPADALAGIAVAALLVPESMGYARVAGVAPEVGLYAALAAVVAYALTGGVSVLVVGPASAVAALSATLVFDLNLDADPLVVTAALAIGSGLVLMAAGVLRMGWIVNFISRPVLEAFVAALSISIIIGQLDGLLGVEVEGESALSKLWDTLTHLGEAHGTTSFIGVGAVAVLIAAERIRPGLPAAIVVVVAGIVAARVLDLGDRGVALVGEIPSGLPDVTVPDLSVSDWVEVLGACMALVLVGFSEGYAAAAAVQGSTGEELDADQELFGSGVANVASGLVGGLAVSGSLSKSAAAVQGGARTQIANVISGLIVLATLLFLAPLFEKLPEPVLAAVVIVAVLGAAKVMRIVALANVNRYDFVAAALTFVLVLAWETLPAMIVGVVLSLAFLVYRATFPDVVELRRTSSGSFVRPGADTETAMVDGVVVIRFEAPLVYANASRLQAAVRTAVAARSHVALVVLDGEMLADLDATGAEVLAEIDDELAACGIVLRLGRVHSRARSQLERSDLHRRFDGRSYPSLASAVDG